MLKKTNVSYNIDSMSSGYFGKVGNPLEIEVTTIFSYNHEIKEEIVAPPVKPVATAAPAAPAAAAIPEPTPAFASTPTPPPTFQSAMSHISPSLVHVVSSSGSGTGVVIDDLGYVLAGLRSVQGNSRVTVWLPDGTSREGLVIGFDELRDVAVIKISQYDLQKSILEKSDVDIGDEVIAVWRDQEWSGPPNGITGNVIAKHSDKNRNADYIVSNNQLKYGTKTHVLINIKGEVVGLTVDGSNVIDSPAIEGLLFAITSETIRELIPYMKAGGITLAPTPTPTPTPTPMPTISPISSIQIPPPPPAPSGCLGGRDPLGRDSVQLLGLNPSDGSNLGNVFTSVNINADVRYTLGSLDEAVLILYWEVGFQRTQIGHLNISSGQNDVSLEGTLVTSSTAGSLLVSITVSYTHLTLPTSDLV